jgi:hypothetical protein
MLGQRLRARSHGVHAASGWISPVQYTPCKEAALRRLSMLSYVSKSSREKNQINNCENKTESVAKIPGSSTNACAQNIDGLCK